MADFKDWIPAEEDPGAFGEGTYRDYVPESKPEHHPSEPQTKEPVVVEKPKPKVKK